MNNNEYIDKHLWFMDVLISKIRKDLDELEYIQVKLTEYMRKEEKKNEVE